MPIHLEDLDVVSEAEGLNSALIVPCNLCPGVTVAVREKRPFMRLARGVLKSAPFEGYVEALQSRLEEAGVRTGVFRSTLYHQWFLCMWTARRRRKLRRAARNFDAVVVLGCDSATETVREAVRDMDCRVIEGMRVAGIMNARLSFRLPDQITFDDCRIYPISQPEHEDSPLG